jgi:hypothetical protein
VRGLRGKRTRSAEKIRSAALAICRKRGGAITRASRRKAGRAGRGEGIRREEMRAAWHEYHQGQAARHRAVLEELIADHEEQAEKYLPKGA